MEYSNVVVDKIISTLAMACQFKPNGCEKFIFQGGDQCDQIGRFIGLWATFQSLGQQLVCPNLPHSLILQMKSFLGNFYIHLATFLLVTLVVGYLELCRGFEVGITQREECCLPKFSLKKRKRTMNNNL